MSDCATQKAMRTRVSSALTFCLLAGLVVPLAAQEKSEVAASIRSLELKWTESHKQRQVEILSTLLAEDFVITVEDGSTYSKTGYISAIAPSPPFMWKWRKCQSSRFARTGTPPW